MPAKIYEYVRFPAWMLVTAMAESATASLLRGTDADMVDPHDVDEIARIIQRRYEEFCRGVIPAPIGSDGRFDRRIQARKLMDLIVARCGVEQPPATVSATATPPNRR